MKIIIAGSRTIDDYSVVRKAVDEARTNEYIYPSEEVVSGGADGVDKLGEMWAKHHNVRVKLFFAKWKEYGRAAGYKRNEEMAEYADGLIAVWDCMSAGTKHIISSVKALDKPCYVLTVDARAGHIEHDNYVNGLVELKNMARGLPKIKGAKAIETGIKDAIKLITLHKTDKQLERMIYKQWRNEYNKFIDNIYGGECNV